MSGSALLERIDAYAQAIRECRPLTTNEVKELDAYFRIDITYTSNALEDNSLILPKTKVLLEDSITMGDRPIRDCYEATGHARAYDYMLEAARGGPLQFREEDMLRPHALFYGGVDPGHAERYREGQMFIIDTEYAPPTAEEVPGFVAGLVEELNRRRGAIYPVLLTAHVHWRLMDIRPFQDGNGRTAWLLMNLIPVNRGYCVVSIPPILRHDYITAFQRAQQIQGSSDTAFIGLICECRLEAQKGYCRMFRIEFPERGKDAPER